MRHVTHRGSVEMTITEKSVHKADPRHHHVISSRVTIGHVREMVTGMAAAMECAVQNTTAFEELD